MRRCVTTVLFDRAMPVVVAVVVALTASLVVAPAASAEPTTTILGLATRAGYNSVLLTWQLPSVRKNYRGVTVWRREGNNPDSQPVLVGTVTDRSRTSYTDPGLAVPSTRVWSYTVYTVDALSGPIAPLNAAAWMTSAMSGRVTDARGNGLGGVLVEVGWRAWSSGGSTYTQADGTWVVDGLTSTSAVACFDPRDVTGGTSTTGYQPECYDNIPSVPYYDSPNGIPLPLTVGALTSGINASLEPGGTVAGTLRDVRGHRLVNAGVQIVRDDGRVSRRAVTGNDGSYRFVGLAPGHYSGCAFQPYGDVLISPVSPYGYLTTCSDGSTGGVAHGTYAVAAGAVTRSDIALADGAGITGQLLGPDGSPIVGEEPMITGPPSPDGRYTLTDANGRYTLTGLVSGSYTVCFRGSPSTGSGDTFDPGRVARCWKAADPASPTTVAVTLGHVATGISVRQYANPTVEGHVVDAQGRPIRDVLVNVDGAGDYTDADGHYRIGVTPGVHTVCFYATRAVGSAPAGFMDQCWHAQATSGAPTPVSIARGARITGIDATLAVAMGVRVTVVDAHGTPLRGAMVDLDADHGSSYNAVTNARGVVTFTRVASAASYTATFRPAYWNAEPRAPYGYRDTGVTVTVRTGLVTARIVAVSNGQISGTVLGADGNPLESAMVIVHGDQYVPSYSTDANGRYAVGGLAPGTYTVCFEGFEQDATGVNRQVSGCYDHTTETAATSVVVQDGTEVTGIDGHLAFS